jgi:TonB family protein
MDLAVDQVLAERERLARSGPAAASLIAAAGLHVAVGALLIVLPRLVPSPPPLEYVAVQLVPAQRLGAVHPAAGERQQPAPRPPKPPEKAQEEPPVPPRSADAPVLPRPQAPPKPPPQPAKPEKPKPPQPDNRVDPTTQPKFLPPPRDVLAKKLGPATAPQPTASPGAATGSTTGKVAVGSLTVSFDQDFPYDYYKAQTLSRIEENWTRSPVGNEAHARISFRIHKDGSISDLTVAESSSFDTFDLAALRAVQNAAPFAPLPRAWTTSHDAISVSWIAR